MITFNGELAIANIIVSIVLISTLLIGATAFYIKYSVISCFLSIIDIIIGSHLASVKIFISAFASSTKYLTKSKYPPEVAAPKGVKPLIFYAFTLKLYFSTQSLTQGKLLHLTA